MDSVFCLFVVCLLLCIFLLKLFALQSRLRKVWFLGLLVCVFLFFPPRITLAMVCSCHLLPALATSTSLSAKADVVVCVLFVMPNHGKNLQRKKLNHVHGLSELLTSVVWHWEIFCIPCNCLLFLIVTMVLIKQTLHLVEKPYLGESYWSALEMKMFQ